MNMSFAKNLDSELIEIPIPNINGTVRCEECLSFDSWKHVDHDFSDAEDFSKEIRYRCEATVEWVTGDQTICNNDITIYIDDNCRPVLPKVKK